MEMSKVDTFGDVEEELRDVNHYEIYVKIEKISRWYIRFHICCSQFFQFQLSS